MKLRVKFHFKTTFVLWLSQLGVDSYSEPSQMIRLSEKIRNSYRCLAVHLALTIVLTIYSSALYASGEGGKIISVKFSANEPC